MTDGFKQVIVIPSYNPGDLVLDVVAQVRNYPYPVWVVVDGSTDGSAEKLEALAGEDDQLTILRLPHNKGKGTAMLTAIIQAEQEGYTHLLSFDSDGQHPADQIPNYFGASEANPEAMILGQPAFGADAPIERIYWRRCANFLTSVVTLGAGIGDSLFGMRVYPVAELRKAMASTSRARRFDFDPEVAVRLSWLGVPAINVITPVRYLNHAEGGVSHFRYGRDNLLLVGMYARLWLEFPLRLPGLLKHRINEWRGTSGRQDGEQAQSQ